MKGRPLKGAKGNGAWNALILLLGANLLNMYDRVVPAVMAEPLRREFGLTDVHLGLVATVFTLVYAVAGIPLGRWADTRSRKYLIALGLLVWSAFTALTGCATGLWSFIAMRIGVGIGEATLAPAANSLIADLFPTEQRSRAVGIFMLGLPLGLVLGFFTVGAIAQVFESWRAPFYFAAVPGFVLAIFLVRMREPARGEADAHKAVEPAQKHPIRAVLAVPTMWWVILSGIGYNFAAYATSTFMVPMLQRYFHQPMEVAAVITGLLIGVTGLIALTAGGALADKAHRVDKRGRLWLGAVALALAAVLVFAALKATTVLSLAWLFAAGWLLGYLYSLTVYPVIQELFPPRLRATAMAVYFAAMYVFGGAFGSILVGSLSDWLARVAANRESALVVEEVHRATGLHTAMLLIPAALLVTAFACWRASTTLERDLPSASRVSPRPSRHSL